jgi:predicted DNA-binding ribbon-helix-helix protein
MPVRRRGGTKRKRSPKALSTVLKRHTAFLGRRTSVSLEDAFWDATQEITLAKDTTRKALLAKIDKRRRQRKHLNLSSAIRLFVLRYYPMKPHNPPGPPMTLGNMRELG